jgi:DNA-binding transcriptional MerR regulator
MARKTLDSDGSNRGAGKRDSGPSKGTGAGKKSGPHAASSRRSPLVGNSTGDDRAEASRIATQGELLPEGKLYYRIGEVAKITSVKPHVLRYWETEFRWMSPPKSRSKQRLYRRKDIEMILVIKRLLYEERYTIAGARQQLRELGLSKALEAGPAATGSNDAGRSPAEELLAGYRRVRSELVGIRALL